MTLEELQTEADALARDAEQLARDAVAFEQPEPQFAQLPALQVNQFVSSTHMASAVMLLVAWILVSKPVDLCPVVMWCSLIPRQNPET